MSCNEDPTTVEWNRQLAQRFGIPTPRLEHRETDTHDIASIPGQNAILLGKAYRRSGPRLKRQKMLHEHYHLLGMQHDGKARERGYYSDPKRDSFSRERLKEVEAEMATRNPTLSPAMFLARDALKRGAHRLYPETERERELMDKLAGSGYARPQPGGWYQLQYIPELTHLLRGKGVMRNPIPPRATQAYKVYAWQEGSRETPQVVTVLGRSEDAVKAKLAKEFPQYRFAIAGGGRVDNPRRRQ